MDLLILYFLAAVVISFICSVLESVLLSVNMPYISVLEKEDPKVGMLLRSHKEHMFLVQDSYGHTEGIVTFEDRVETILGVEIMDESDSDADMRELAKRQMRLKRRLDNTERKVD